MDIEKDIKIVRRLIENTKKSIINDVELSQYRKENRTKAYKSLENILAEIEQDKARIEELEKQVEYDKTHIITPQTIALNYIPKQKITEEINRLKIEQRKAKDALDRTILEWQINVLEKMLEEK